MDGESPLGEGALVYWEQSPGEKYGVIERLGARVQVLFDDGERRMFATRSAPLVRVQLPPQVRRRSTDQPGFLVESVDLAGRPAWRVSLLSQHGMQTKTVPEADLRPDNAVGPVERIKAGDLGTHKQARLTLTARHHHLEHLHNDLVSLANARVDLKPHQVGVAHRVVTNYPHRFLLCDEVGLGKTIEAGMILKELRARGGARRVLIIVPPNLQRQWQFELKSKFNETFAILNTDTVKYHERIGNEGSAFTAFDSVIVSSHWITQGKRPEAVTNAEWDLVILDEAHHARRQKWGNKVERTKLYDLVARLADPSHFGHRGLLFLTATPMQLASYELYSLIELLDPALFPTEQHFEQHRRSIPGLSHLVEALHEHGFPIPTDDPEDTIERVAEWLNIDISLAAKRLAAGPTEITALCAELSERHLLSEVMIRNRKSVVGGFMPRHAFRWPVELSQVELDALDAVEHYVAEGWNRAEASKDNAVGFVMTVFQKLMASSIRALRASLDGRRIRLASKPGVARSLTDLEDALDDDGDAGEVVAGVAAANSAEIEELESLVELLDRIEVDSKGEAFLKQLGVIFEENEHSRVLVFTEFRETQNYLAERILDRGWNAHLFHGQMSAEAKDGAVEAFREGSGSQVLISTEAGGEGRNFQFCHLLVNYDLPWNPMRVEQRIGRVDRIGQTEVVQIFNMWVKGTIEERVLDVLERRINVFEETVGGLDPILGDTEKDLRKVLRLARGERDAALAALEATLEERVHEARVADEKLQDFIMNTKSFSREIAERIAGQPTPITPDDQERFVTALLADVRTYIPDDDDGERQIVFNEPFLSDYPEFVKGGPKLRVTFRADRRRDSEYVEYMAFGHPIVDALMDRVLSEGYPGVAGARRLEADRDLAPVQGWLFAYVINVPGIRTVERLEPVFVSDTSELDTAMAAALVHRSAGMSREQGIPPERLPLDGLDVAAELAEQVVAARLNELEVEVKAESLRRLERERHRMAAYFEYRERAGRDRLENSRRVLINMEDAADSEQRRIIPVWRANVERDERLLDELARDRVDRLAELDRRVHPIGDYLLASVTRIEVVSA